MGEYRHSSSTVFKVFSKIQVKLDIGHFSHITDVQTVIREKCPLKKNLAPKVSFVLNVTREARMFLN